MIHLRAVSLNRLGRKLPDEFPFNVPVIKSLTDLAFTAEVTFLVGENGSGKSTFLEGIAAAAGSITVGSEDVGTDKTLQAIRKLAKALKLTWAVKKRTGFFLRSEDFFGYVKRLSAMRESMLRDLADIDEEYKDRSETARGLARMPFMRELNDMKQRYGDDLDGYSHGESYFTLFKSRFVPNGLYLLDEPEAPLSPMRQIVLMSMIKMMLKQDAQFIIATHSPILLAFPGATILQFANGKIEPVAYDDLEHVIITKTFLNNPRQYLDRLMADLE
jgi:predicted ATPase